MSSSARNQLGIALLGAVVLFVNLGATRLWDQDEAYFARTAVEMHQRHEWVVPYFNDEMFAHKPPLMYWMMHAGFILFGVNEFAARFWSAAFGIAAALLVYRLGRKMFNDRVGLWAGLAMCTSMNLVLVDRAATPDSLLVFFSALALHLFARRRLERRFTGQSEAAHMAFVDRNLRCDGHGRPRQRSHRRVAARVHHRTLSAYA